MSPERTPLVSVVLPTAGPAPFLDETVASVLEQSFESWELLLIDNGTERDLKAVAELDPRLRLIDEPRRGPAKARNAGLRAARGELVAFLDHDDLWDPEKLAEQTQLLLNSPTIAGTYNAFDVIDDEGRVVGEGWAPATITFRGLCRAEDLLTGSNLLVRARVIDRIGPLDEALAMTDDADLLFRIAREQRLQRIDRVLTHYRLHRRNTTRDYALVCSEMTSLIRRYSREAAGRTAAQARADRRAGLRRIHTTYSAQAFDAFRATWRHTPVRAVGHLASSLRMDWRWPFGQLRHRVANRS